MCDIGDELNPGPLTGAGIFAMSMTRIPQDYEANAEQIFERINVGDTFKSVKKEDIVEYCPYCEDKLSFTLQNKDIYKEPEDTDFYICVLPPIKLNNSRFKSFGVKRIGDTDDTVYLVKCGFKKNPTIKGDIGMVTDDGVNLDWLGCRDITELINQEFDKKIKKLVSKKGTLIAQINKIDDDIKETEKNRKKTIKSYEKMKA